MDGLALRTAFAMLLAALPLGAQRDGADPDDARWREDPYTHGDPALIEQAGWVRIGHFTLGDRHDTRRAEADLGRVHFRWIETPHFKLGCELPEQKVPRERADRDALRQELRRLAERLPGVRAQTVRELDPWLRAHLFAQRLEELYADVEGLLGVTDADFPGPDAPFFRGDAPPDRKWMGRGPFLGVKGKFIVLLCEKESTSGRYLQTYTQADPSAPSRWYFLDTDCFAYVTSMEFADGVYSSDRAMHACVRFNVARSLLDAFKGFSYQAQAWWTEGLAHWLRREVVEDVNAFSGFDGLPQRAYEVTDWGEKVRQRLENDLVRPLGEIMDIEDPRQLTLVDHWACWSRVEYIIEEHGRATLARFIDGVKGYVDARGNAPTKEALAQRQREVFAEVFGTDPAGFDAAWAKWARRRYR
ncbi:MAG: hypothetical protein IPM29_17670 [Planctomycetes bacterium]|nr:hypothetical protein [Planctomycetota bacterium]